MQDTQLTSLGTLATQLKKAVSDAVANNDPTTLMGQVQSIFDQATAILNSKDANGDYIYGGGKTDTAPVTVIVAGGPGGAAFGFGRLRQWHRQEIGAGGRRPERHLRHHRLRCRHRPDAGAQGHRQLRCRRQRQFQRQPSLSQAQNDFLTSQIASVGTVATNLNTATAAEWLCL